MDLTTHLREDGTGLLVLSGEIDVKYEDTIRDAGLQLLATDHCHQLTVDLRDVTFIDSCGMRALVAIRNQAEWSSRKLILQGPQQRVKRELDLTGLTEAFLIDDTE